MSRYETVVLAGLGYGDEGKGSMTDYFVRKLGAKVVVRYNGGAQAGHNVVTVCGNQHVFSQFSSGTFVPGVITFLSKYMLVNPFSMLAEEKHLLILGVNDALERMFVDREALVVTPYQQAANRLWEIFRGNSKHGSCGMGIGQTMQDFLAFGERTLFIKDLLSLSVCQKKLEFIRQQKLWELAEIVPSLPNNSAVNIELSLLHGKENSELMAKRYWDFCQMVKIVDQECLREFSVKSPMVFEGAQGVLLDQDYGFFPYNTWTNTTFQNSENLLKEIGYQGSVRRVGITRAYMTRHGAGPFVTEDPDLSYKLPDDFNSQSEWQGNFRVGHLDLVALKYAKEVCGHLDEIAVTCLDRISALPEIKLCTEYRLQGQVLNELPVFVPADLKKQECLTNKLFASKPLYRTVSTKGGYGEFLSCVSNALKVPIKILSFGPTAEDKMELSSYATKVA